MPITLSPQVLTVTPFGGFLDTRAPNGVPLPTPNVAPVLVGHPTSLSFSGTGLHTYDFSPFASDANDDAITYSLTATRTGVTINATTGVLSVQTDPSEGNITIQLSDGVLTSDYIISVSVQSTTGIAISRVFDEPYPAEEVEFPAAYSGYSLMRPALSHTAFPDVLPPNFNSFSISAISDVYVWTIATISKTGWTLVTGVTATGVLGNVWKLYKYTNHSAGAVTVWGANGLDTTNGDLINLPPLFMVPAAVQVTATPMRSSWQLIGTGTPNVASTVPTSAQMNARYWTDVSISAPAGTTYTSLGTLNTALAAANPGDVLIYNNTVGGNITGTVTASRSGTWAAPIYVYVTDPNATSLSGAGKINITGDHVIFVGWASTGSSVSGKTSGTFVTANNADYSVFHHCSEYDQVDAASHNAFYCGGRMTGIVRCFVDCTHAYGSDFDGIYSVGYDDFNSANTYIPCPIVRRTWFKGAASAVNQDLTTPMHMGEQTGADMGDTSHYGYWTGALLYRNLFELIDANIELVTLKANANAFIQNRVETSSGAFGSRGGFYHTYIGNYVNQQRSGGPTTYHDRAGTRVIGQQHLYYGNYWTGLEGGAWDCYVFGAGNDEPVVGNVNPAYIAARDILLLHETMTDVGDDILVTNQPGSTNDIADYPNHNKRIYFVNCVLDAGSFNLIDNEPTSTLDNTNKMSNCALRYAAEGSSTSMVGISASLTPAWSLSGDFYRPTASGNLTGIKTLTVKLPDIENKPRTTYKGALEPAVGNNHPVTLTTGVGGNVGPETTLLSGF